MKFAAMLVVLTACSHEPHVTPDAEPPVDACALPYLPLECVDGAFDALSPDGEWHLVGMSTTTVNTGSPPFQTTTTMVDKQIFIQRFGCTAGVSWTEMPAEPGAFISGANGVSYQCDHAAGCARGRSYSAICVHADGQLVYQERSDWTSTMLGAHQTWVMVGANPLIAAARV